MAFSTTARLQEIPDARLGLENGTFTPTLAFGGNSVGIVYVAREGRYQRIGNTVTFSAMVEISNKGSSTGTVSIRGLPYTSASGPSYPVMAMYGSAALQTGVDPRIGRITASGSGAILTKAATAGDTPMDETDLTATFLVYVSGTYFV